MPLDEIDYSNGGDTHFEALDKTNLAIVKINEIDDKMTGGALDQVRVKDSAANYDFRFSNSVLPGSGISGNVKIKSVSSGDWDMDGTASINVAHGVTTGITKIHAVSVKIYPDDSSKAVDLLSGGTVSWDGTNVIAARTAAGMFDSALYNSTGFNRAQITITYEV